jgi:hypothetical protein
MKAVLDAVRRIIMRWTVTRTKLIAAANAGDTSIQVQSTRRFLKGDQFLIHNADEDMENQLYVLEVVDRHTITLADANGDPKALNFSWPVAEGTDVVKTQNDQFIKGVFLGDPAIITEDQLPAITVSMKNRSSEVMTFRATKERYNVEINVYVSGSTQEEGDAFLLHVLDQIQWGLKKNFYPLLDEYKTSLITADIAIGDQHIKVPSVTMFTEGSNQIIIEDDYNIEVHSVNGICDSTTIRINNTFQFDFDKDDTIIIKPGRLPFNSWPSDINFGLIKKGDMLKAATISYFVEEMEDHPDASFGDTQLR